MGKKAYKFVVVYIIIYSLYVILRVWIDSGFNSIFGTLGN